MSSLWLPDTRRLIGAVRWVTFPSRRPSRPRTRLGSDRASSGTPEPRARCSSMKESSAPESTRKVRGSLSRAHNRVPGSSTRDEGLQGETVLASTLACADELNFLAARRKSLCDGPPDRSKGTNWRRDASDAPPRTDALIPARTVQRRCSPSSA